MKSRYKTPLLVLLSFLFISAVPVVIDNPVVVKNARDHFSTVGSLQTTHDGFVYVKVSDEFIYETLKILDESIVAPPAYFGVRKVGAHITAITKKESQRKKLFLPQLGQAVVFAVKRFEYVDVETTRYYYLSVEAPQIELIRLFNGLPPKIAHHEFHITIGIEHLEP